MGGKKGHPPTQGLPQIGLAGASLEQFLYIFCGIQMQSETALKYVIRLGADIVISQWQTNVNCVDKLLQ